jgi:hypothetical protein
MGNFQKLRVWQLTRELAVNVYKLTKSSGLSKDYSFRDQIQRSAVSIPSNIAEGDELETDRQAIRHFYIAKGSSRLYAVVPLRLVLLTMLNGENGK